MPKQKKLDPIFRKNRFPAKGYSDYLKELAENQGKTPKYLMAFRVNPPKGY